MPRERWFGDLHWPAVGTGAGLAASLILAVAWAALADARAKRDPAEGPAGASSPSSATSVAVEMPRGDLAGLLAGAQRVQKEDVAAWRRFRFNRLARREWFDESGKVVEKEDLLFHVTPTTEGFDEELVQYNGGAPPADEVTYHRRQARFTRHYKEMMEGDPGDAGESGYSLSTLLRMSAYQYSGMEVVDGVLCHRLDFQPEEDSPWGGITGKIARAMAGSLWITVDGYHLARARSHTVEPVNLYLSLSRVKELEISMESHPAPEPDVWLPHRIEVVSTARILFNVVRKRTTFAYSDYEPIGEPPATGGGR